MPRAPLPPVPEEASLCHETFDADYFLDDTNASIAITGFGVLDQSWSGYALERSGESVVPFVVPAVDSTGHINVSCDVGGALRLWIEPFWSSGTGPGAIATILELDGVSGGQDFLDWTLQVSADGTTLYLISPDGAGSQQILQASIAWQAGEWHCLILNYGLAGTALYIDGIPVAQGSGLMPIARSVGRLVLGSTISGTLTAGGDVDEFESFDYSLGTRTRLVTSL
jgi:hypothetical protein